MGGDVVEARGYDGRGFDGRTFGGVELSDPVLAADLTLSGVRGWSWRDGGATRLHLERDVVVAIGAYEFVADAATVWIEASPSDAGVELVAVVLEGARSRGASPYDDPTVVVGGERVLVTGRLRTSRGAELRVDELVRGVPAYGVAVERILSAQRRLAGHLRGVAGVDGGPPGSEWRGVDGVPFAEPGFVDDRGVGVVEGRPPVLPERGTVTVFAPTLEMRGGPGGEGGDAGGDVLVVPDGLTVLYEPAGRESSVQLTAQRGVVFLERTAAEVGFEFSADEIAGIYLEGDVQVTTVSGTGIVGSGGTGGASGVGSGRVFRVQGDRVYYEPRGDRGVFLDAVFSTVDDRRGLPLYVRADAIRQVSAREFRASGARLANIGFARPHFSLGARELTITRPAPGQPDGRTRVSAEGVTVRAGGAPVFWLPSVEMDAEGTPLRKVAVNSEQGDTAVRTEWDLAALLGLDSSAGNDAALLVDGFLSRGVGVGVDLGWSTPTVRGELLAYGVYDTGEDQLTSGAEIDSPREFRGLIDGGTILTLGPRWTTWVDVGWVSDVAFTDAYFEGLAETRREFIAEVAATRVDPGSPYDAVTVEVSQALNNFIPNEYLLQSSGYQVEKLPEVGFYSIGRSVFDGALSYTGETTAGAMNLTFAENRLRRQGFDTDKRAQAGFGLGPDDRLSDRLRDQGYSEATVMRLDSRHEIEAPMRFGALRAVPFAVGRFTAWDTDFDEFTAAQGRDDEDSQRLFGAVGLQLATTLSKVDNTFQSELFDLNRMRHLIEPSVTIWQGESSVDQRDLPVYDETVESLADGFVFRAGVTSTWQTMRGRPGQQVSVDWLKLRVEYVSTGDDDQIESPIGSFDESRPELSNLGDFVDSEAVLQLTDAVALTGSLVFDTDKSEARRSTAGVILDHGYGFSSFVEYRELDTPNASSVAGGARYELTKKYAVELFATYDIDDGNAQRIGAQVQRRFPQWTLDLGLDFDEIEDNVGLSISMRAAGIGGDLRRRVYTRDDEVGRLLGPGSVPADRERLSGGPFG